MAHSLNHASPGTEGTGIDPPLGSGAPVGSAKLANVARPHAREIRRPAAVCTPAAIPSGPSKVDVR
jgi:hypothetical protein